MINHRDLPASYITSDKARVAWCSDHCVSHRTIEDARDHYGHLNLGRYLGASNGTVSGIISRWVSPGAWRGCVMAPMLTLLLKRLTEEAAGKELDEVLLPPQSAEKFGKVIKGKRNSREAARGYETIAA